MQRSVTFVRGRHTTRRDDATRRIAVVLQKDHPLNHVQLSRLRPMGTAQKGKKIATDRETMNQSGNKESIK